MKDTQDFTTYQKAKITITRNLNNPNQICISVTNEKMSKILEIVIKPEQLALALTGLGYQNCELVHYNDDTTNN